MSSVTNVASDESASKDAYARVKGDWEGLDSDQLLQVNLEPYFAAETVLGAWPKLKAYRDRIAKEIPSANISLIDKLQDYVLALRFVQSRYAMATKGPNNLEELVEEANKLCDILEADAKTLSLRGLFDPTKLAGLQGGNSYKALADDLEALAHELEAIYPSIRGKCATTPEDLKAAMQMSTRLTRLRGEEHISPAAVAALTEERQRAFTQVIKAYDEARAAIAFLRRREGDLEQIAPNLYIANTRRRKGAEAPVIPAVTPPTSGTPAPVAAPPSNGTNVPVPGPTSTASGPFLT